MSNRKARCRLAAFLLLTGVIAAIFVLSSQPYRVQNIQPYLKQSLTRETAQQLLPGVEFRYGGKVYGRDKNPFGLIEFLFRKTAHLIVYAALAAVTALVMRLYRMRWMTVTLASLPVVLLISMLDEWNQQFSSSRTTAYQDVLLDLAGGILGVAVCFGVSRLAHRFRRFRDYRL